VARNGDGWLVAGQSLAGDAHTRNLLQDVGLIAGPFVLAAIFLASLVVGLPAQAPVEQSDRQTARRSLSRWAVHLGLLGSAAAALGTLDLLHVRIAIHTDVGLVFVALVVAHLAQRPRTLAGLATRTVQARTIAERAIRLAASDLLLLFITLNVLVSGVLDWNRAAPIQLPIPGPFGRWHAISGLTLIVYLAVHVWRRRKRLRRSMIR
jgi:hypothetical protein